MIRACTQMELDRARDALLRLLEAKERGEDLTHRRHSRDLRDYGVVWTQYETRAALAAHQCMLRQMYAEAGYQPEDVPPVYIGGDKP